MLAFYFAEDQLMQVSHETIYQALYVQSRGTLRADFTSACRSNASPQGPRPGRGQPGVYSSGEEFTISDRPAEVPDRAVPGHWEGDLIIGAGNTSAIGTFVERSTRFTILLHLPDRPHCRPVGGRDDPGDGPVPRASASLDHLGSWLGEWPNGRDIHLQLQVAMSLNRPGSTQTSTWAPSMTPSPGRER